MLTSLLIALCLHAPSDAAVTACSGVWDSETTGLEAVWTANQENAKDDGRGTPYKVDKADNICGLVEPRQLTKPALVDYDALLKATSEHQEIVKKKIDPSSAKGIELMTKARDRVRKACESVRVTGAYCSVWKTIAKRNGTAIDDVTDLVKKAL